MVARASEPAATTTARRLTRGVYLHPASGVMAYLGTLVTVIDSHGEEVDALSCHVAGSPERRAEAVSEICAALDRLDPPRAGPVASPPGRAARARLPLPA